jgi:hypothetical protein
LQQRMRAMQPDKFMVPQAEVVSRNTISFFQLK